MHHERLFRFASHERLAGAQPNIDINLFLVAPDERREKVKQEILRPTFSLEKNLWQKFAASLVLENSLKNWM